MSIIAQKRSRHRTPHWGPIVLRSAWTDLCADTESGRALAITDYDNDGDPDVFIGNRPWQDGQIPENVLLINRTLPGEKHFLKVLLHGSTDNSYGIGSIVSVESPDNVQTKIMLAGSSFRSQNASELIFGLGDYSGPVTVRVRWPSGRETIIQDSLIDRTLSIVQ